MSLPHAAAALLRRSSQSGTLFGQPASAGASGFLLKNASPEELVAAVRTVAGGDSVLDPRVAGRVMARFARRSAVPVTAEALSSLTEREKDVLALLARGLSNAEIAQALVLAEATVKTHLAHILPKLGLRDRVQAVVFAYESGLVQPGAE